MRRYAVVAVAVILLTGSIMEGKDIPSATIFFRAPWGTKEGQLGMSTYRKYPPQEALCPKAFQLTPDGTLWILDTVNYRVVAFKGSKVIREIRAEEIRKYLRGRMPFHFAVSGPHVYIANMEEVGKNTFGVRLHRFTDSAYDGSLVLNDKEGYDLDITEFRGLWNGNLLFKGGVRGDTYRSATLILDPSGKILHQYDGEGYITDPKGRVYKVDMNFQYKDRLPVKIMAQAQDGGWKEVGEFNIPQDPKLYETLPPALKGFEGVGEIPLGIDSEGNFYMKLSEGRPSVVSFAKVNTKTKRVIKASLEDMGLSSRGIGWFFNAEWYQLLPTGDILVLYQVREEFRIIKISWPK